MGLRNAFEDISTEATLSSALTELQAIKAKTDNIPVDPATESGALSQLSTEATLALVLTELQAIKAKTDSIPSDPAREGGILSQILSSGIPVSDLLLAVRHLLMLLVDPMFVDPLTSRVRVSLEAASATLTAVSTVTTLTNLTGFPAKDTLLNASEDLVWADAIRRLVV